MEQIIIKKPVKILWYTDRLKKCGPDFRPV